MPRRLALFDLDHTLLPVDSDYEWGEFLGRSGVVDGARFRQANERFYQQYRDGTLDIREFLEFALAPLARIPAPQLRALQDEFMASVIAPVLHPRAQGLVAGHREAGDLCAVVTATNAFVTAPIAEAFGVAHLIASIPAQRQGRFTGAIEGTPCYREGKITRVTQWLETLGRAWHSFDETVFYSDSHNDLALLGHVTEPVATNADATLRQHALDRGWRTLELFDDSQIHQ